MKFSNYFKYVVRFVLLQFIITFITIYYFDRFLINEYQDGFLIIINNLLEDKNRFYPFVPISLIKIDIYLAFFIFLFLLILYSTKFYTYVNELTFTVDQNFTDEFFKLYLIWTSSLMTFLIIFRFTVVSRFYLILFTLVVPVFLQIFRNTEFLSSILGRSTKKENFITFNIEEDSIYRKLRILTFRTSLKNFNLDVISDYKKIISEINHINKKQNLNLIVINLKDHNFIPEELETFLIDTNKKVLLISSKLLKFKISFIKKSEFIDGIYFTYFNNDIQYGSKYILKRIIDILFSIILLILCFPILLFLIFFVYIRDGHPSIIRQRRVGLHGQVFSMYKFRTMYKNAHEQRKNLEELNKNDEVIFKIQNDPRIFYGGITIRKYSLDELPQLFNILKGEMSLVGPRPLFEEDSQHFDSLYMRRLNVLPGLTGLLQINERNTDSFKVWYKYDIEYINNWSLFLDLKILLLTPISLFKKNIKGM